MRRSAIRTSSGRAISEGVTGRAGMALLVLSIAGILSRVAVVSIGMLRIDVAAVLIFGLAAYLLPRDWVHALALLSASTILYLFGAALPLWLDFVLLITGALLASTPRWVPKWLQLSRPSSS